MEDKKRSPAVSSSYPPPPPATTQLPLGHHHNKKTTTTTTTTTTTNNNNRTSSPANYANANTDGKDKLSSSSASSSSSSDDGYFSTIFPPDSTVMRKYSENSGPHCWTSDNLELQGRHAANAHFAPAGRKQNGSSTNWKPTNYYPDATESPYFGSSVHYGGREFYTNTLTSKNTSENTDIENSDDSNYATRGNWWQGSLYY